LTLSFFYTSTKVYSQCTCGVEDLSTYECITSSGDIGDLTGFGLLGPVSAATTPQFIILDATLTIEQAYTFYEGSIIVMMPDAEIIVTSTLNIPEHITIRGCGDPWTQIRVTSGARLRLKNSDISNSCQGINLESGSRAEIVNNNFTENYICIQAAGFISLLGGKGIAHNTFDGTDIPSGCSGGGSAAIRLTDVEYIVIGNMTGTGSPNEIISYNVGIDAINSGLKISNTTFTSITAGNVAIKLVSTGTVLTADISGLGHTALSPAFIEDYTEGIWIQNYNLTLDNAYFKRQIAAIRYLSTSNLVTSLDVQHTRFEDYTSYGIFSSGRAYRTVNIQENDFEAGNEDEDEFCIGVAWYQNRSKGFELFDNVFNDNDKPDYNTMLSKPYRTYGILASAPRYLNIQYNDFSQNYSSETHDYRGILLNGLLTPTSSNDVIGNNFIANFGPLINGEMSPDPDPLCGYCAYVGLNIGESPNNTISCNTTEGFNSGIRFEGPACANTDFKFNAMTDDEAGLHLTAGKVIGQQTDKENLWPGAVAGDGVAEAIFDPPYTSALLMGSKFLINDAVTTSDYWADPVSPSSNWFHLNSGEPSEIYNCPRVFDPEKSETDRQVIEEEFEAYLGYPASTWEAELNAYAKFAMYPDLLIGETTETEDFYDKHNEGNIGKFYRAMVALDTVDLLPASVEDDWDAAQSVVEGLMDDMDQLIIDIEEAEGERAREEILEEMDDVNLDLQDARETCEDLADSYLSDLHDRAAALLLDLGDIEEIEIWEVNLKTVLTFYAQRVFSGATVWSAGKMDTLQNIADQCRFEGGIGVVMARVALNSFDYDDVAMCPGVEERSDAVTTLRASVVPNPSAGNCRITFRKSLSGSLSVTNSNAQIVRTIELTDANFFDLDTRSWPNGTYFLAIEDAEGQRSNEKLVVIH